MQARHYLDIPIVREICEVDSNFREHLEEAWGKPPLPNGYRYNSYAVQVDGDSMIYKTADVDIDLHFDIESSDWTTGEVFLDGELILAKVREIPEPILNRMPETYFPNF
jgi:hypothetical protein